MIIIVIIILIVIITTVIRSIRLLLVKKIHITVNNKNHYS